MENSITWEIISRRHKVSKWADLLGNDHNIHIHWQDVTCGQNFHDKKTDDISSSGPTRRVAPRLLAIVTLAMILS